MPTVVEAGSMEYRRCLKPHQRDRVGGFARDAPPPARPAGTASDGAVPAGRTRPYGTTT